MDTKLNLSIEKNVLARAKEYADKKETSLSALVENYFILLTQPSETPTEDLTPITRSLKGAFRAPEDFEY